MSDIFREVEEEVRRERFEKLWKEYGDYIIAVVALIIIAAAGIQLWHYYERQQTIKASDEYSAAVQSFDTNPLVAANAFQKLAQTAPGGYAAVAQVQEANALVAAGRNAEAVQLYQKIAAANDPILGNLARLRAGWAMVNTAPKSEVQNVLAPLTDPTSAWRFMAREILAYDDYRLGDMKAALSGYQALANEKNAPNGLRQRCKAMATFITAGGDRNVGVVPPALPAAPIPGAQAPQAPAAPAGAPQK
ncbi:MAG TPA: tetratricopeptide repeat protein [Rhizomicrobium sp.]|nr:tetratricopeptide repeat protein [Rhizomicrobium sp.]